MQPGPFLSFKAITENPPDQTSGDNPPQNSNPTWRRPQSATEGALRSTGPQSAFHQLPEIFFFNGKHLLVTVAREIWAIPASRPCFAAHAQCALARQKNKNLDHFFIFRVERSGRGARLVQSIAWHDTGVLSLCQNQTIAYTYQVSNTQVHRHENINRTWTPPQGLQQQQMKKTNEEN